MAMCRLWIYNAEIFLWPLDNHSHQWFDRRSEIQKRCFFGTPCCPPENSQPDRKLHVFFWRLPLQEGCKKKNRWQTRKNWKQIFCTCVFKGFMDWYSYYFPADTFQFFSLSQKFVQYFGSWALVRRFYTSRNAIASQILVRDLGCPLLQPPHCWSPQDKQLKTSSTPSRPLPSCPCCPTPSKSYYSSPTFPQVCRKSSTPP